MIRAVHVCTLHLHSALCPLHPAHCTLTPPSALCTTCVCLKSVYILRATQGRKGVKCKRHFFHASTACRFPSTLLTLVDLQVVQVCAEHKKPAKLLKHLTQIKVCLQFSLVNFALSCIV